MAGQFSAHIWTSIASGFIISFPFVLYQFWSFISPGLYQNEKKHARGFIFISSILFLLVFYLDTMSYVHCQSTFWEIIP